MLKTGLDARLFICPVFQKTTCSAFHRFLKVFVSFFVLLKQKISSSGYLRDIVWQASGNSIAQALGILAMPILTRLYSPSDFAVLNLFVQLVTALSIFVTFRLEFLVMLPQKNEAADLILKRVVYVGLAQTVLLTGFFTFFLDAVRIPSSLEPMREWLWLAPLSAWMLAFSIGYQQRLQRIGDFRITAISEFLGRLAYLLSCFSGYFYLPNIFGLIASGIFSSIAKILCLVKNRKVKVWDFFSKGTGRIEKRIARLAITTSLSNLISLFSSIAPMVVIGEKYGANVLGAYGLVVSTLYLPTTLLGQAIGQVYYQRSSELFASRENFSVLLIKTSKNLLSIGLPLYFFIGIISPFAYPLAFGPDWSQAGEMARWMSFAALAGFVSTPLDRTSLVVNAWWYLSCWHLARAAGTAIALAIVNIKSLSALECVVILSLVNFVAYIADWFFSFIFSKNVKNKLF